ncbi:hypothetical protein WJX72_012263 [[Myrmecia] bisecta]|uniref:Uncharacterized protein n=1 Tax=[Myrmecia] bisecta TaxID=41462 RepID=A0AAW1QGT4_9CHLO
MAGQPSTYHSQYLAEHLATAEAAVAAAEAVARRRALLEDDVSGSYSWQSAAGNPQSPAVQHYPHYSQYQHGDYGGPGKAPAPQDRLRERTNEVANGASSPRTKAYPQVPLVKTNSISALKSRRSAQFGRRSGQPHEPDAGADPDHDDMLLSARSVPDQKPTQQPMLRSAQSVGYPMGTPAATYAPARNRKPQWDGDFASPAPEATGYIPSFAASPSAFPSGRSPASSRSAPPHRESAAPAVDRSAASTTPTRSPNRQYADGFISRIPRAPPPPADIHASQHQPVQQQFSYMQSPPYAGQPPQAHAYQQAYQSYGTADGPSPGLMASGPGFASEQPYWEPYAVAGPHSPSPLHWNVAAAPPRQPRRLNLCLPEGLIGRGCAI